MHILIAPNAFKNSLPAEKAATAISRGLQQSGLSCTIECFPVGDGGDGTAALLLHHFGGITVTAPVHDPLGKKIDSFFGVTNDGATAIIELADASGLRLLKAEQYDPLHAGTYGTGELVLAALDRQVRKIILCIGGSATIDAGMGILQALGLKLIDSQKKILPGGPAAFSSIFLIDATTLDNRLQEIELIVLCDVENTLLGPAGSAPVFGPQKGASPGQVKELQALLTHLNEVVKTRTGKDMSALKHGGAAGGVAAGLYAFAGARLVNGINYFLESTGISEALDKADLLITGEGSIDLQTLHGKGPFGVARLAREKGIPVIGMAGKIPEAPSAELLEYFTELISINDPVEDEATAMRHTEENLVKAAERLGSRITLPMANNFIKF